MGASQSTRSREAHAKRIDKHMVSLEKLLHDVRLLNHVYSVHYIHPASGTMLYFKAFSNRHNKKWKDSTWKEDCNVVVTASRVTLQEYYEIRREEKLKRRKPDVANSPQAEQKSECEQKADESKRKEEETHPDSNCPLPPLSLAHGPKSKCVIVEASEVEKELAKRVPIAMPASKQPQQAPKAQGAGAPTDHSQLPTTTAHPPHPHVLNVRQFYHLFLFYQDNHLPMLRVTQKQSASSPNNSAAANIDANDEQANECAICLGTDVNLVLSCSHSFHSSCISDWVVSSSTSMSSSTAASCPICRAAITDEEIAHEAWSIVDYTHNHEDDEKKDAAVIDTPANDKSAAASSSFPCPNTVALSPAMLDWKMSTSSYPFDYLRNKPMFKTVPIPTAQPVMTPTLK